jgi:hypothetical protein
MYHLFWRGGMHRCFFVCELEGKRQLETRRNRWEGNIKMHLKGKRWDGLDFIPVSQYRGKWLVVTNTR